MPPIFINYSTLNSQHNWRGESIEDGQQENQLENTRILHAHVDITGVSQFQR
jgi:hypothetical protein